MKAQFLTFFVLGSIQVASIALAAPGNLDPTFSGNGLASLRPGNAEAQARAVTQQADGKLVLAGWGEQGFLVARLLGNGTPDETFGTDGFATAFDGGDAFAVIQQTDGKLVVAGYVYSPNGDLDIALTRFGSDGVLDNTFGDSGLVTLDIEGGDDSANALVLQADGKLVIAGAASVNQRNRMLFARFNTDGSIDTTFGSGGTTLLHFGRGTEAGGWDLVQQSDGKLVAVGTVYRDGASTTAGIARLTENGTLDPSFSSDGRVAIDVVAGYAAGVALQPNGAIVIAGYAAVAGGSGGAVLWRVGPRGGLDRDFGTDGVAHVEIGVGGSLDAVVVQENGKLTASGGTPADGRPGDMVLTRFNSDGSVDATFGVDGLAIADFGIGSTAVGSHGGDLIQQFDGKLVAVAWNTRGAMGAARFDDNAAFPGIIGLTETEQRVDETSGTVTYTVRRTGGTTGQVSVELATVGGTAEPGADFNIVTHALHWNDSDARDKTITIDLIDDVENESFERFTFSLLSLSGNTRLAASKASTRIESDDGPGEIYFSRPNRRVFENFGGERIPIRAPVVRVNGSNGAVSVNYRTVDGTATAGEDFNAASGTLTWANGETGAKYIRSYTCPDTLAEGDENFQLQLRSPTGGATIRPSRATQDVLITDINLGSVVHYDCIGD